MNIHNDMSKKLNDVYNAYVILKNYAENLNMKNSSIYILSTNFILNYETLKKECDSTSKKLTNIPTAPFNVNKNSEEPIESDLITLNSNLNKIGDETEDELFNGMFAHMLQRKKDYENFVQNNIQNTEPIDNIQKPDLNIDNTEVNDKVHNDNIENNNIDNDNIDETYDDVIEEEIDLDKLETNPVALIRLSENERETLLANIYEKAKKKVEAEFPGNEEMIFKEADRLLKIYIISN